VTDMLGGVGEELDPAEKEPLWWQSRYVRFREYYQLWKNYGFIRMFRTLMATEEIKQRVLSLPNGERRLTNILHLTETIHRASIESRLGISALLKWFSEQRGSSSAGVAEHQLRLESDERAVKIVTIHKSKGLEYPIVFCPFGWESSVPGRQEIIFHGPDDNNRLTLDLMARKGGYHMTLAQNELLAENLRLLYVALTRAKMRCYLVWGRINTAETSALAYVLHDFNCSKRSDTGDNIVGLLAERFLSLADDEIVADLQKLAKKSKGTIEFALMPSECEGQYESEPLANEKLSCRIFNGRIDKHWKVSSYSSLISKQAVDLELPDYDVFHQSLSHAGELPFDFSGLPSEQIKIAGDKKIFSFPKGTRAGVFFHDIFEQLDFSRNDTQYRKDLVIRKLQEHGFDLNWETEILYMIDNALSVPLFDEDKDFVLSSVTCEDRINEMEFYYPLNPIGPRDLKKILAVHSSLPIDTGFPDRLGNLTFMPTAGYLKGFIDMVFKHRQRYYLVDWKSNYLGDHIEEYHRSSLSKTMGEAYYILQYHLYTLALHQYLRLRKPDYRYEEDFGGVFYVFLRGVDQQKGSQYGIFRDLPAAELIVELGKALISDF
jgi:exodeoxyribonuclease V beta subunit